MSHLRRASSQACSRPLRAPVVAAEACCAAAAGAVRRRPDHRSPRLDASILGLVGRDGVHQRGLPPGGEHAARPSSTQGRSPRLAPIFVAYSIGAVALANRRGAAPHRGRRARGPIAWAAVVRPRSPSRSSAARADVTHVLGQRLRAGPAVGHRRRSSRRHRAAVEGAAEGLKVPTPAPGATARDGRSARWALCSSPARRSGSSAGCAGRRRRRLSPRRAPRRRRALVEESLYVGEHGVHLAALASGARFTADATGCLACPSRGRPGQRERARPRRRPADLLLHRRDGRLRLPRPPDPRRAARRLRRRPRGGRRYARAGRRLGSGDRPGVGDRDVDPHRPRRRPLPRASADGGSVFGLFRSGARCWEPAASWRSRRACLASAGAPDAG